MRWCGWSRAEGTRRQGGADGGTRTRTPRRDADFRTTSAFAATPRGAFVVWTIPSPWPARGAVGAARLVSTPSRGSGLGSGSAEARAPKRSPNLSGSTRAFPRGHSNRSLLRLPVPPRPHAPESARSPAPAQGPAMVRFSPFAPRSCQGVLRLIGVARPSRQRRAHAHPGGRVPAAEPFPMKREEL